MSNKKYIKPDKEELKKNLSSLQYKVTQESFTESPFLNEFWEEKREGIYVDIVTGEPLFSSFEKFDSSCGWPSFAKPLEENAIIEKTDKTFNTIRTEVRSKQGDSHLGHVFEDGPKALGGLRYCINSASLRFITKEEIEREGYGDYLRLFKK